MIGNNNKIISLIYKCGCTNKCVLWACLPTSVDTFTICQHNGTQIYLFYILDMHTFKIKYVDKAIRTVSQSAVYMSKSRLLHLGNINIDSADMT